MLTNTIASSNAKNPMHNFDATVSFFMPFPPASKVLLCKCLNLMGEYRASGGLAALGFPDGAESGAKRGDMGGADRLHSRGFVCVILFLHLNKTGVNSEWGLALG